MLFTSQLFGSFSLTRASYQQPILLSENDPETNLVVIANEFWALDMHGLSPVYNGIGNNLKLGDGEKIEDFLKKYWIWVTN